MSGRAEGEALRGTCPFCLGEIAIHFDIKNRPYWRCWRCEVRSFGTRSALHTLTAHGWIWCEARPLEALRRWLDEVALAAGLTPPRP